MKDFFASLCITSMICSFITASYVHVHGQVIKPFGPRMCGELCNRISGCTKITFEVADLSCRVDDPVNRKRSTKDAALSTDPLQFSFGGGVLSCPSQFMTVLTRKKKLKCVKYCIIKDDEETQRTRLLIVKLQADYDQGFLQLFLGNRTFHTHPVVKARLVSAIAVAQKSGKLLIAANKCIMSVPVDSSNLTVIQRRIKVRSMAVDEEKDILFMTFKGKVKKMTLSDRNIQTPLTLSGRFYPSKIVLDPSNNMFFLQSFRKILSVTYECTNVQMLVEGTGIYNLLFDPDRSLLYYSKETELFSFSLTMKVSTELMSISFRLKSMAFFNNEFYVYGHNDELGVIRDWKYKKFRKIFETHPSGVKMCFVR